MGGSEEFIFDGGWAMTLVVRKPKSPHKYRPMSERQNRLRGSNKSDVMLGIYEKGQTFTCFITGEDPAEYFKKYKRIWIPQRIHYPISYAELRDSGVKNPDDLQYVMFTSPNGHKMIDNHMKGLTTMQPEDAEICELCGLNSWDMFVKYNKVLKMEYHHTTETETIPCCPTCHASTGDHSVNVDAVEFPANQFANLLEAGVLNLDTLYAQLRKYSPKLTKSLIQIKFYGMGLHRIYDNKYIPVPRALRKFFQNTNASKYFEV